jgi:multiple sugar transport system ATP-binding protein
VKESIVAEVALRGVSKRFGAIEAVADLDLSIDDGEFVVLLGPTGAGKTTILRLVAGLTKPDTGAIWIVGLDVTRAEPSARDTAFVFQQYSLYPHLTAFNNLAFPLRSPMRRLSQSDITSRVNQVAQLLRIEDKLHDPVTKLSGGQMQRVAIGRALVRRPAIYLMDEPLSSLDAKLRADLSIELKRIQEEMGATMLYVTHDQIEAMTLASRVGVMERGRLVQLGTPRDIYENPSTTYVATRLGQPPINLIPRALFSDVPAPAACATIGARTEHIAITAAGNQISGSPKCTVSWIEHLGDQNHLHLNIGETQIVTLADPDSGLRVGDSVSLRLSQPLFFAANGERVRD